MIRLEGETEGMEAMLESVVEENLEDAFSAVAEGGEMFTRAIRRKLGREGGPSAPGQPPAKDRGALQDSIGRTGPFIERGVVTLVVGVGVGDEALARVNAWKSKGVNVFEYAHLHEVGGIGADGRRYPARSYVRSTEMEIEGRLDRLWRRRLK